MRNFQTITQIKIEHPHAKLWILQSPGGPSFMLGIDDEEPKGKFYYMGEIP